MKNKKYETKDVILTGMFAAVLAVLSQIQFPLPSGVPVTMQTFAVALTGYVLGWKFGLASVFVYILLGAVGVPVFAGFSGGLSFTVSPAGGFIWGFLPMAALCGFGYGKKMVSMEIYSLLGLAACHLIGVLQFMLVMNMGFVESFLMVSVPYLVKDILSMAGAFVAAKVIRAGIRSAGHAAA